MRDRDYGWTVEMQVKAARAGLRVVEVRSTTGRGSGRARSAGPVRGRSGRAPRSSPRSCATPCDASGRSRGRRPGAHRLRARVGLEPAAGVRIALAPRVVRARVRRVPRGTHRVPWRLPARAAGVPGSGPRLARSARRRATAAEHDINRYVWEGRVAGSRRESLPLERPARVDPLGAAARRGLLGPQPQGLHGRLPPALRARDAGGRRGSTTPSRR